MPSEIGYGAANPKKKKKGKSVLSAVDNGKFASYEK